MVKQQFWGPEERRRDYLDVLGDFIYGYRCTVTNDAVSKLHISLGILRLPTTSEVS